MLNNSEARDYRVLVRLSADYPRLRGRFQGITELVRRYATTNYQPPTSN